METPTKEIESIWRENRNAMGSFNLLALRDRFK